MEPIPNVSNLKEGFCHISYALWKNDLNGLSFNPQSPKEWVYQDGEKKCSLLMYVSIPTAHVSLIFVYPFLFSPFFFFVLPLLLFCSFCPPLMFTATTFHTIYHGAICHFYPSTTFGFLWVSFQDCPLAFRLLNHYCSSECVGCITLNS